MIVHLIEMTRSHEQKIYCHNLTTNFCFDYDNHIDKIAVLVNNLQSNKIFNSEMVEYMYNTQLRQ